MPECPTPLLGPDLLSKLGAQITFGPGGATTLQLHPSSKDFAPLIMTVVTPREEEWRLFSILEWSENSPRFQAEFPLVWAEDNSPGLALNRAPVVVELTPGTCPQRQRQYPIS